MGGTGTGKSSTLNAIFEHEISRVGRGCDPETMQISSNKLIPNFPSNRIITAINQADMAMKGRH